MRSLLQNQTVPQILQGDIDVNIPFDRWAREIYVRCLKNQNFLPVCGNKMPTRCNRWFLLQNLLLAQHISGTIMPIIRNSRVLYRWFLPVVFGALVFKLSVWCGAEGYVSGLQAAPAACKPDTLNVSGSSPQTGHTTLSSTPCRQLENQSTKYHRQQPSV